MSERPGLGVMIGMLGGNAETVAAIKGSLGKRIASATLADDRLALAFTDGTTLTLWDDGQSCCESRYMRTDADLSIYVGAALADVTLTAAPSLPEEYGEHEIQVLNVHTDKGVLDCVTHNEHNGYCGGFWIVARISGQPRA